MKRLLFFLILATVTACGGERDHYALIETDFGNIKVLLYNSTPHHRDNFIRLVKEGFYDGLLFHRVIEGFMIQGGDPNSRDAPEGALLGAGGPGYQLQPEIGAPHLRGALAAARNPDNPEKLSSGSQFYLVQGGLVDDTTLDDLERRKGIKYNAAQRMLYKQEGGVPALDNEYTVFGEIVEGYDVLDKIAAVPTDMQYRPVKDVRMTIRMVN